ncbi:hypothetical protein [Sporolactobacillus terrae]|uniref:Uncharacterized protein n=1 Tax=Sporolactobacillus terrae TaxID=269673 RepID=A0A5K7X2L3_9BACL|nr:hypothetical protein [Sporolactobacillus terrae]BBN99178.1 hypothetical protein St703_18830 [Sporolactobacillus terrae]
MIPYKGEKPNKKQRADKPLTKEDIERLMNVNMPTYHRAKGGALKQK